MCKLIYIENNTGTIWDDVGLGSDDICEISYEGESGSGNKSALIKYRGWCTSGDEIGDGMGAGFPFYIDV